MPITMQINTNHLINFSLKHGIKLCKMASTDTSLLVLLAFVMFGYFVTVYKLFVLTSPCHAGFCFCNVG